MDTILVQRKRLIDQFSMIAMALSYTQARDFCILAHSQRTQQDWLQLRASLYQALSVEFCESQALLKLKPLDHLLVVNHSKLTTDERPATRWKWSSHLLAVYGLLTSALRFKKNAVDMPDETQFFANDSPVPAESGQYR